MKQEVRLKAEELLDLLKRELLFLEDAAGILEKSYEVCRKISVKKTYPLEELDRFEALTSRFVRLSDLFTQKILRTIDELDLETPGTVRDRIHRAEKKEIIPSADTFVEVRLLRNEVAHEYLQKDLQRMFYQVLEYTPLLLQAVRNVQSYCDKF